MLTSGLRFLPLRLGGFILHKLAFQMHLKIAVKTLGGKINKLEINKAEVNHLWHDFSLALMFLPVTAPELWLEILALSSVVTPTVRHRRQWLGTEGNEEVVSSYQVSSCQVTVLCCGGFCWAVSNTSVDWKKSE